MLHRQLFTKRDIFAYYRTFASYILRTVFITALLHYGQLCGDAQRRRDTRKERKAGGEKEGVRTDVNGKEEAGKDLEER